VCAEELLLSDSVIVALIDLILNITLEYASAITDIHLLALNAFQTLTMVVTQFQTVQLEHSLILNKRSVWHVLVDVLHVLIVTHAQHVHLILSLIP